VATIGKINGVCRDDIASVDGVAKASMANIGGLLLLTPLWVATGRDGWIMYSSDAISWSEYRSPPSENSDYWDIAFGKDSSNDPRWIIATLAAAARELRYSADPTGGDDAWSSIDFPGTADKCRTVEYGANGTWIAGSKNDNIFRSTDGGGTWTEITAVAAGAGIFYCLATDGEGTWLAGGSGSSILKSFDDGLNWYVSGTSVGQVNGVEYNNGVWFLASNTSTSYRATTIAQSDTTDTWSVVTGLSSSSLWAICHIEGDTWMTAGKANTPSNPFLSTDNCASWSPVTSQGNGQIMGLASDGTTIVVTDKASKIYTSTDNGSSWTLRHTSTSADVLVVDYNKVKPFDICT